MLCEMVFRKKGEIPSAIFFIVVLSQHLRLCSFHSKSESIYVTLTHFHRGDGEGAATTTIPLRSKDGGE